MPAVKKKLVIEQGATFMKRFIRRSASKRPINLTGYKAKFIVKTGIAGALVVEATTENGMIVIDPLKGVIDIKLTDELTTTFSFTNGWYNLTVEDPSSNVTRLAEGVITLSLSV